MNGLLSENSSYCSRSGMQPAHPVGGCLVGKRPHPGLQERPVQSEIDLGDPRDGRELAFVLEVVAARVRGYRRGRAPRSGRGSRRRSDRRSGRSGPSASSLPRRGRAGARRSGRCCWRTRHAPSSPRSRRRRCRDGRSISWTAVDDRLSVRADIVDAVVKVEDPAERLLRRRDVVALRAEDDDRRADVAQVHARAPRSVTISAVASLLPTKSSSTMNCISSALRSTWPPHQSSNPR